MPTYCQLLLAANFYEIEIKQTALYYNNVFENVTCKMFTISSRPEFIKRKQHISKQLENSESIWELVPKSTLCVDQIYMYARNIRYVLYKFKRTYSATYMFVDLANPANDRTLSDQSDKVILSRICIDNNFNENDHFITLDTPPPPPSQPYIQAAATLDHHEPSSYCGYFVDLVPDCCISSTWAMKILQSGTKPPIYLFSLLSIVAEKQFITMMRK